MPALDLNWVDTRNKKSQMKLEKLDNDLKNYKSNSIKVCIFFSSILIEIQLAIQESIRRGHDDLGDHFLDSGDLANALKCYRFDLPYAGMMTVNLNLIVGPETTALLVATWSQCASM